MEVVDVECWTYSCDPIKISLFCLFAGMTTYILRGSLLASVAFTGGLVLSMFFTFFVCKIFNGELKKMVQISISRIVSGFL